MDHLTIQKLLYSPVPNTPVPVYFPFHSLMQYSVHRVGDTPMYCTSTYCTQCKIGTLRDTYVCSPVIIDRLPRWVNLPLHEFHIILDVSKGAAHRAFRCTWVYTGYHKAAFLAVPCLDPNFSFDAIREDLMELQRRIPTGPVVPLSKLDLLIDRSDVRIPYVWVYL